jgi:predicted nucleotidyltransferase
LKKLAARIVKERIQMAGTTSRRFEGRSLDEIMKILSLHKPELYQKWKVKSLGIFGSYVRGEAKKRSDLDLLVEIDDPKMSLLRFIALENYLSDLLGVKVDLVEKQTLKPAIGRHILEEAEDI